MGTQLALSYWLMKAVNTVIMSLAVEPEMSPGPSRDSTSLASLPRTAGREATLVIAAKCPVSADVPCALSMVSASEFLSGMPIRA